MASEKKLTDKISRLQDELDKKNRILSSIYKISQKLNRTSDSAQLLKTILHESRKIFGFTRAIILFLNKEENSLETKYCIGFTPEEEAFSMSHPLDMDKHLCLETLTVKQNKTIYIRDMEAYARANDIEKKMARRWKRVSNISAPLRINREAVGSIGGDRTHEKMVLTGSDIRLFSYFASLINIILENARLLEQNKKRMTQFISLQELSQKTSSTLNYGQLLNIVAGNATKLVHGSSCALMMPDDKGRYFRIAASRGYEKINTDLIRIPANRSICGFVAASGKPTWVEDTSLESAYVAILSGVRSQLYVPLVSNKRILGVIRVDRNSKKQFSSDDQEVLAIFAGHASALVENALLYEQILEQRNLAQNILESAPNGILTIDKNSVLQMINRKAEQLLKVKRRNVLDRNISTFLPDKMIEMVSDAIGYGKDYRYDEITMNSKSGTPLIYGATSAILYGAQGNINGAIITIQDLTQIKKTESMLWRTEKLSSLGQMSASIAHEIRNPLASINFNVQLLSKKISCDSYTRQILDDTLEGINRIKSVVQRTLDYTRELNTSLRCERIDHVLEDAVALVQHKLKERSIVLYMSFSQDVPPLLIDSHQLQQVFVNLLLNAVEAISGGGTITIRGKKEYDADYGNMARGFLITIEDSGVGIVPNNLKKIFDPFFTTKQEGTGLGLSIVHKILEQHKATIDVKSFHNKGTIFSLRFPLSGQED